MRFCLLWFMHTILYLFGNICLQFTACVYIVVELSLWFIFPMFYFVVERDVSTLIFVKCELVIAKR